MRVLVAEKIGDSGVQLLKDSGFDVELGADWDRAQLEARIGEFDGILIRSATQLDADLIAKADNLKAVGRAGVGVDNVDVEAATSRGIIVANAPQSNVVTAAEHTMALLLALARNVPQAHASLVAGRWDRSKYSGVELYDKTLGVIGFGRIGQLVAERAQGFGMKVVAYDPYVGAERCRELGVQKAETPDDLYAEARRLLARLTVISDVPAAPLSSEPVSHGKPGGRQPSGPSVSTAAEHAAALEHAIARGTRAALEDAIAGMRAELRVATKAARRADQRTIAGKLEIATADGTAAEVALTYGCSERHVYRMRSWARAAGYTRDDLPAV